MTDGRTELAAYLSDRDVPCPGCRYNLRGVVGAACPECGRGLRVGDLQRGERARLQGGYPPVSLGVLIWLAALNACAWIGSFVHINASGSPLAGVILVFVIPVTLVSGAVAFGVLIDCRRRSLINPKAGSVLMLCTAYMVATTSTLLLGILLIRVLL